MLNEDELPGALTVAEVAALFRVDRQTVLRWDQRGKLKASFRTLGGHRRYRKEEVLALLRPEPRPRKRRKKPLPLKLAAEVTEP
jgi:excisionase family DNA binding protein